MTVNSQARITRKIYERQHLRIAGNKTAEARFFSLYQHSFGLDPAWFRGKRALDAGCGNVGALMVQLIRLGCKKVYGLDIGTDWIPLLNTQLKKSHVARSKYELGAGDVLNVPFKDGYFDFVSINGVLIHLADMDAIQRGFAEGARVCKSGGYYFTAFGPCGGLLQGTIMPALRTYYREHAAFRAFIDSLRPEVIHAAIDKICADAKRQTGEDLKPNRLKLLFGEDYCVFLQNFIQAPTFWSNECTPTFVEGLYHQRGFTEIRRFHQYVKRSDIRKYFAPLHYDREYPLSKLLYGEGYVQYIARKLS